MKNYLQYAVAGLGIASAVVTSIPAWADFGEETEKRLQAKSVKYFGIVAPLENSAEGNTLRPAPFNSAADPKELIELAKGLKATILTRNAANDADMFSLYPRENPTHLVFCIENNRAVDGADKPINPSIQTIDMESGAVDTVAWGLDRCDGIRTTPWNTILATEETGGGSAWELLDPLSGDDFLVMDRGQPGDAATIVDPDGFDATPGMIKRTELPAMGWEGLAVLPSGVVYAGDELRPGTGASDKDGGSLFKFIPTSPREGDSEIDNLAASPLVDGRTYAFRADCLEGTSGSFPQFGQGCEIGNGSWVEVVAMDARDDANEGGATGYYRPEDLHLDPEYDGKGIRFCWANTGRSKASNYGEIICGIDFEPLNAASDKATTTVNRFVEGDTEFNSFDNLAFQPGTGNLYLIEDTKNGDVIACLPDGKDRDIKSDGCLRILSVKDQSAEPTGFGFDASGLVAWLSIQHSGPDELGDTDDILMITGFKVNN